LPSITIIDYGMGNLLSVARAFEHCGAQVHLTDSSESILNAERIVLPGVGAFADGMTGLRDRGFIEAIKTFAVSGKPFLGICLGMQMMLTSGEEFGIHEGLGLVPGRVIAIPPIGSDGRTHKIPHIGWNRLRWPSPSIDWSHTILAGLEPGVEVYFVHSFTAVPSCEDNRLANCDYDGCIISAVIKSGSLYGCQFHPEKSGAIGLSIIKNFIGMG
jgi:imidazole glycerol-phosphate synthase subunit HisH